MRQPRETQSHPITPMCDFSSRRITAEVAQYFRAISHPTRLRIVQELATRDLCVAQLVDALHLPEPVVSRHLTVLRHAGITTCQRRGTRISNHLGDGTALRVLDLAGGVKLVDAPEWHL